MVTLFKTLAQESRLRILSLLMRGEMCVCEIEHCLCMSQSNASRQLTALKRCGLIQSEKRAQWIHYRINDVFIHENPGLWMFLSKGMEELPTYNADEKAYEKCKQQDLCNATGKPH